jgi:hypothetical protein
MRRRTYKAVKAKIVVGIEVKADVTTAIAG